MSQKQTTSTDQKDHKFKEEANNTKTKQKDSKKHSEAEQKILKNRDKEFINYKLQ